MSVTNDTRVYVIGYPHDTNGMKDIKTTIDSFEAVGFTNVIMQEVCYIDKLIKHRSTAYPFNIKLDRESGIHKIEEFYSFFNVLRKIKGRREDKKGVIITRAGAKLQRDLLADPYIMPTLPDEGNRVSLRDIPVWPLARGSVSERIMPSYGTWIQPEVAWNLVNRTCKPNKKLNKGDMKKWGWEPIKEDIEKYLTTEIRNYYDNYNSPKIYRLNGPYHLWHQQVRYAFRTGLRPVAVPINVHGL